MNFLLKIESNKVLRFLISAVIILFILNIFTWLIFFYITSSLDNAYQVTDFLVNIIQYTDFDNEYNLPTVFSVLLLILIAVGSFIIGQRIKRNNLKFYFHWILLSIIFLYLAFDEFSVKHEMLIDLLRARYEFSGIFYFPWIIPGIILVFLLTIIYWKFVFSLPKNIRLRIILAATVYLGGALGLEMISPFFRYQIHWYKLLTSFEELLEMMGLVILITVIIDYYQYINKRANLSIKSTNK